MRDFKKSIREIFNRPSPRERAAFLAAVTAGDTHLCRDFMARFNGIGSTRSEEASGSYPLHIAAAQGHFSILQLLIAAGADVNARDSHGETPLHRAAAGGHNACIIHLCKRGAEVDAAAKDGATPLAHAAQSGKAAAVRLLLDYGADADMRAERELSVYTPLHRAAYNDDAATVKTLLEHAEVFKRGTYNRFYFQRALSGARPAARAAMKEWADKNRRPDEP